MGGPAAVDGQNGAGEVPGRRVGEQQRRAGELGGVGPAAERDLGGQEMQHLRVVVDALVEGSAERAGQVRAPVVARRDRP